MLKKVRLAQRNARVAEYRVGRRDVEEEIGECKAREILGAKKAIAHAVRELEHDFALIAALQGVCVKAREVSNRSVASVPKLGEAVLGIRHRRSFRASEPG